MIKLFRTISFLEGISFLVILFIAYVYRMPEYIRPVGMTHGLLFVAYVLFAIMTKFELNWKPKTFLIVLAASFIPFGTFYIDKKYLSKR